MSEYVITVKEEDFNLIHKLEHIFYNTSFKTIEKRIINDFIGKNYIIEIGIYDNQLGGWQNCVKGNIHYPASTMRIDIKEYLKSKFCEVLVEVYPSELDDWKDILINNLQLISDQYVSDPLKMIPIIIDKCKSSGEPAVFAFNKFGKYDGYMMDYNSHHTRECINTHYPDYLEMSFGEFNYHLNINSKELSLIDKLKQDRSNVGILINKYLIKDGDVTKTYNNVIKFLEEYGNTI